MIRSAVANERCNNTYDTSHVHVHDDNVTSRTVNTLKKKRLASRHRICRIRYFPIRNRFHNGRIRFGLVVLRDDKADDTAGDANL